MMTDSELARCERDLQRPQDAYTISDDRAWAVRLLQEVRRLRTASTNKLPPKAADLIVDLLEIRHKTDAALASVGGQLP